MKMREHWRGILEWSNEDLSMSSASNEACKMYDAALTQFIGWYDDARLGGIGGTLKRMLDADHDFVMGHCLDIGLSLNSTKHSPKHNIELAERVDHLLDLAAKNKLLTERDHYHVEAINLLANGDLYGAAQAWEKILVAHPTDLHALRMAHDVYFYLGLLREMRDSISRVLPFWQSSAIPLKGYLHGMHAFGLCETNFFGKAEAEARKGLERNPNDAWATHSLAHVMEMQVRIGEGVNFLGSTENDWNICNHLATHNYWHKAIFHIEENKYDEAIKILDEKIIPSTLKSDSALDMVDCTSLLYRLTLTGSSGLTKPDQWNSAFSACKPYLSTHTSGFNDAHYLMACLGSGNDSSAEELLESLNSEDYFFPVNKANMQSLLKAMICYKRGKFSEAVELLLPIRYQIIKLGGSEAQRDVFNQLLIVAAIKSKSEEHRKLAEHLLIERENLRPNSPLTGRLVLQLN